jgi:hypothetical protein
MNPQNWNGITKDPERNLYSPVVPIEQAIGSFENNNEEINLRMLKAISIAKIL